MSASAGTGDANHNHYKTLEAAILNRQLDEVRNLLEHDLDKIDINGCEPLGSPLWVACASMDVRIVALLLEYGADPNHGREVVEMNGERYYSNDDSPIWFLMRRGYPIDVLSHMLQCGADPNVIRPSTGWSLLHCLCYNADCYIYDYLLRQGINPKLPRRSNGLPLFVIIIGKIKFDDNPLSRLRILLEYGADPNLISRWGMPPLFLVIHRARGECRLDVIRLMMRYGADVTIPLSITPPLYLDCANCIKGDTVLHTAIGLHDVDAIRLMTECQAITTFWWLPNDNGDTVYDLAAKLEAASIIEYFDMKLRQESYGYLLYDWIPKSCSHS